MIIFNRKKINSLFGEVMRVADEFDYSKLDKTIVVSYCNEISKLKYSPIGLKFIVGERKHKIVREISRIMATSQSYEKSIRDMTTVCAHICDYFGITYQEIYNEVFNTLDWSPINA